MRTAPPCPNDPDASAAAGVTGRLARRDDLTADDRDAMFRLLDRHFAGIDRPTFDADLAGKGHALLLRDAAGRLVGFSTIAVYAAAPDVGPATVVCSGDTIVDPSAWSSPALPREWIAAVRSLRADRPPGPMLWLLLAGGHRTYRLLGTFWHDFWPRHDAPTPPAVRRRLDALAIGRYGEQYDPASGVVRLKRPQVLRGHLAGVAPRRRRDPHVAFFERVNPGHADGDELACLCDLSDANLTRAGRRMVFGAAAG